MGVDDAAAVAWLVTQKDNPIELVGVSAVWGNTLVEHAANNAAALLGALGFQNVPIVIGEASPVAGTPNRVGAVIHGIDGLWGSAKDHAGSAIDRDLVGFYRGIVAKHPGATLLALGPLTNLSRLLHAAPDVLRQFGAIVVLGGAKHEGSMTPVAEANFWHDPEAAESVLAARLPIVLITRDAHRSFALQRADLDAMSDATSRAARFLASPAKAYARVTEGFGEAIGFPDIVAAMYAVDPSIGRRVLPALVKVIAGNAGLARGQSIIGLTRTERLTMIESGSALLTLIDRLLRKEQLDVPGAIDAILNREPDNANVVLEIDEGRVREWFLRVILAEDAMEATGSAPTIPSTAM